MIPAEFDYVAPRSLDEAQRHLAGTPGAKVLAGGMSLIPAMKHRLAQPPLVVDLGRIPELEGVEERRGRVRIGARATHAAVGRAPELAGLPVFAEAARVIGDRQVQNRGTVGGSLVHADPAADWPAVFLALDGEARVVGPQGRRKVPAEAFFRGMLTSAVEAHEILTELRLEVGRKRCGAAYQKVRQPASGFAVVGVAAQVRLDRKGRCEAAALGVTGVNPVPFRARSVEARLAGRELDEGAIREACAQVEEAEPLDDPYASAEYRGHLLSVHAARALGRAWRRAAS